MISAESACTVRASSLQVSERSCSRLCCSDLRQAVAVPLQPEVRALTSRLCRASRRRRIRQPGRATSDQRPQPADVFALPLHPACGQRGHDRRVAKLRHGHPVRDQMERHPQLRPGGDQYLRGHAQGHDLGCRRDRRSDVFDLRSSVLDPSERPRTITPNHAPPSCTSCNRGIFWRAPTRKARPTSTRPNSKATRTRSTT